MYERAVHLLEAELGDEILTLDPAAGQCFGFNPVAASIWRRLAQPAGFDELKQTLLEELRELMQVLVDRGLVRHSNSNSGVS